MNTMYYAARNGHTDVVEALALLPNVNASAVNNYDATPMYFAAQNGYTDIVNILASISNINVGATDNVGVYVSPCRCL